MFVVDVINHSLFYWCSATWNEILHIHWIWRFSSHHNLYHEKNTNGAFEDLKLFHQSLAWKCGIRSSQISSTLRLFYASRWPKQFHAETLDLRGGFESWSTLIFQSPSLIHPSCVSVTVRRAMTQCRVHLSVHLTYWTLGQEPYPRMWYQDTATQNHNHTLWANYSF